MRRIRLRLVSLGLLLTAACGGDARPVADALPPCEDDTLGGAAGSGSARAGAAPSPRTSDVDEEEKPSKASSAKTPTKPAKPSGAAGRGAAGAGGSSKIDDEAGEVAPEDDEVEPEPEVPEGTACPDPSTLTPSLKVSGSVRLDSHTWKGVVAITGETEVLDTEVTIEPGTVILAAKGAGIVFGRDGEVTLNARGTADQPIRFCGADGGAGFWKGVSLADLNPASSFEHVLIEGAGSDARAFESSADVPIHHLRVRNSGSAGIKASNYGEGSDDWVIEGSRGAPLIFTAAAAVTRFPRNVEFIDNHDEFVIVRIPRLSDEALVFRDIGMPWLQEGDFVVEGSGDSQLTFEAGVDYRVAPGKRFTVTANPNAQSEFQVLGTEAKPVKIRGSEPAKGSWFGLRISQVTPASKLSHLEISDAGRDNTYALDLRAEMELQDVTVKNNAKGALFQTAPSKTSKGFSAVGNDGYALEVLAGAVAGIPQASVFENNEFDMIEIRPGTLSPGVAKNHGVPYHAGKLQLDGELKIEAGTEFVFGKAGAFTVGQYSKPAVLTAIGTSSKLITFRGEEDANGSWAGLKITSAAGEGCALRYVQLMNAGLILQRSAEVRNSSFAGSATYGITKPAADMTDYAATNTFSDNAQGEVGP